jgi:BlaI family transcriptional regulator, penicillinase repressor
MARPKHEQPTPAELEVLQVLWDNGPCYVRQVMDALNRTRPRAYTSVMSLMNVMADKGLVSRRLDGRAYVYEPAEARDNTLGQMVGDLLSRAFEGSTSALVAQLLDRTNPSPTELEEIRRTIEAYRPPSEDA